MARVDGQHGQEPPAAGGAVGGRLEEEEEEEEEQEQEKNEETVLRVGTQELHKSPFAMFYCLFMQ